MENVHREPTAQKIEKNANIDFLSFGWLKEISLLTLDVQTIIDGPPSFVIVGLIIL